MGIVGADQLKGIISFYFSKKTVSHPPLGKTTLMSKVRNLEWLLFCMKRITKQIDVERQGLRYWCCIQLAASIEFRIISSPIYALLFFFIKGLHQLFLSFFPALTFCSVSLANLIEKEWICFSLMCYRGMCRCSPCFWFLTIYESKVILIMVGERQCRHYLFVMVVNLILHLIHQKQR